MAGSFFTEVQGKFRQALVGKQRTGLSDFQGRYLAVLLDTVGRRHPEVLGALLNRKRVRGFTSSTELDYLGDASRWADLAIYEDGGSSPIALVEIKANDRTNKTFNEAQIDDYAAWCRLEPGRHVYVLTHLPLPWSTRTCIAGHAEYVTELSVTDFGLALRAFHPDASRPEVVQMLLDYLEDKGLAIHPLSGEDVLALKTFLAFSFLPHISYNQRVTSTERVANSAKVFSLLVQNWQLLGAHAVDAQRASRGKPKNGKRQQRPVAKFQSRPFYPEGTDLTPEAEEDTYDRKLGGKWWVFAESVVGDIGGRPLYLTLGMALSVMKGTSEAREPGFDAHLYASFFRGGKELACGFSRNLRPPELAKAGDFAEFGRRLSDQRVLLKDLRTAINRACANATKRGPDEPFSVELRKFIQAEQPHLLSVI